MDKLLTSLRNCYGIEELDHDFDFTKNSIIAVYSPNGTMKTSFAKTFQRISEGKMPVEELFRRTSSYSIKKDNIPISKDDIFVVKSYVANYDNINQASTLLVDEESKKEYDEAYAKILSTKNSLIAKINRLSGIKRENVEEQFLKDMNSIDFFDTIDGLKTSDSDFDYSQITYSIIFNDDVIALLKNEDVEKHINDYITKYNEIIEKYTYLKKGVFNPDKAEKVLKSLKKESFFKAEHTVNLKGIESPVNEKVFDDKVKEIKEEIAHNEQLKEIQKLITQKVSVVNFQELLGSFPELIHEIKYSNLESFKKKLWISYIKSNEKFVEELLNLYKTNKAKLTEIEAKANLQQTLWDEVIKQFSERFFVPYLLEIENKKSAVLGQQSPNIIFKFFNQATGIYEKLERNKLEAKDILSQGEKRALYLLNILYEVKVRERENKETIFIIDDIADSFDYKNKYAILEYLKDISRNNLFYQIILTHNFDFFRTIQERLLIDGSKWHNSLITYTNGNKIQLSDDAGGQQMTSPFAKWKGKLNSDPKILIATIPFVRNLVEYKEGSNCESFKLLTSILHYKNYSDGSTTTKQIEIGDIKQIYTDTLKNINFGGLKESDKLYTIVLSQAELITTTPTTIGINLENKIILSIAIRLKAEEFMFSVLSDKTIPVRNQTAVLYERCKTEKLNGNSSISDIDLLDQVNLMTPENIHLNSFMYEPLIDVSEKHLIELYNKIKILI